jgi:hypothetical protein
MPPGRSRPLGSRCRNRRCRAAPFKCANMDRLLAWFAAALSLSRADHVEFSTLSHRVLPEHTLKPLGFSHSDLPKTVIRSARMTSSSQPKDICRRSLLKSVPMIAGVIISTNVATQSLFAQAKATHEAAEYQDHPKDGQQCSGCQFFVVPNSCKVVEDPVAASGWCQLFAAKSA